MRMFRVAGWELKRRVSESEKVAHTRYTNICAKVNFPEIVQRRSLRTKLLFDIANKWKKIHKSDQAQ